MTQLALPIEMSKGKRLGKLEAVAETYGVNKRTALRWADMGLIPWGLKIGGARRWDMDVVDEHIRQGCPRVTPTARPRG